VLEDLNVGDLIVTVGSMLRGKSLRQHLVQGVTK
jgi:hypothetical protein